MCEDCQALKGGGRKTPPHANLVPVGNKRMYGRSSQANEQDYRCSACGHEWTHETGNAGYGWM